MLTSERPVDSSVSWGTLIVVSLQLGMIAFIIHEYDIESPAFFKLALLVWGGFTLHARLPRRFRLPFFAALGVAAAIVIFGLTAAAWMVGAILIVVIPARAPRAVGILLALAVLGYLGVVRVMPRFGPAALGLVLPILASMLMFRLFLLLRAGSRPPVLESFAYLLLLPNLCFPLFPVIDFKTFRRSHYSDDAARIYETGVRWLTLGIVHLLLYRLVYYRLAVAPSQIATRLDAIRYILASYLMYLRISGDFHMCVGILHLFGFNLPASHDGYFFASSFTDFYRRINIYWKDFMLNVFYVPAFMRLKRIGGGTVALVGATVVVFVVSWLLHSYQWFWLRGWFPLNAQDMLFWGILGGLVLIGALIEDRYGRERWLVRPRLTLRRLLWRGARTALTFTTICLLWSMWSSESLSAWRLIVTRALPW